MKIEIREFVLNPLFSYEKKILGNHIIFISCVSTSQDTLSCQVSFFINWVYCLQQKIPLPNASTSWWREENEPTKCQAMGDIHLRATVYMWYIKTVYFNFYRNPASWNYCKSICSSDKLKTLWDAPQERKPSPTSGYHFLFVTGLGFNWTMKRTTQMLPYNMEQ